MILPGETSNACQGEERIADVEEPTKAPVKATEKPKKVTKAPKQEKKTTAEAEETTLKTDPPTTPTDLTCQKQKDFWKSYGFKWEPKLTDMCAFLKRQCNDRVCWCVRPKKGKPRKWWGTHPESEPYKCECKFADIELLTFIYAKFIRSWK